MAKNKYVISTPNKHFAGMRGDVHFVDGQGETNDENKAKEISSAFRYKYKKVSGGSSTSKGKTNQPKPKKDNLDGLKRKALVVIAKAEVDPDYKTPVGTKNSKIMEDIRTARKVIADAGKGTSDEQGSEPSEPSPEATE